MSKTMLNPGQLPCVEVLLVAAEMFNIEIRVYHGMKQPVIYKKEANKISGNVPILYLQCISLIHYNPFYVRKNIEAHVNKDDGRLVNMIQANYDSISSDKSEDSSDSEEYDEAKSVNCDINTVAIKCNHEVLPYSQILVYYGNCQLRCLVDLGAQISLITESRWRDLKNEDNRLRLCNSNNKILGVANSQANILGYAQIKLNIMTDTESVEIPFAIVKDSTIPCCVVLGINYIKRNAIIIDYENKRLVQTTSTGEEQYKSLNPRANELVQAKFNVPDFLGTVALDGNSTEEDDSDQGQEENSESENYRENLVPKFLISNEELRVMQNNNYAFKGVTK